MDWFETAPIDPPLLKSSMREIFDTLALMANCRGVSSVTFVPTTRGVNVAFKGVFWTMTVRVKRVCVLILEPS